MGIVCFCKSTMSKGTPHQIYDDNNHSIYNCHICDRSFHFEKDKHLIFTCPQNIHKLHWNGFVICSYCVWIIYTYQKNIKYYKHYVATANSPQIQFSAQYNQQSSDDHTVPLRLRNNDKKSKQKIWKQSNYKTTIKHFCAFYDIFCSVKYIWSKST